MESHETLASLKFENVEKIFKENQGKVLLSSPSKKD